LISVNLRETVAGAVTTILSPKLFFQTGENLIHLRLILGWDPDFLKPRAGATQDFNARLCYPENLRQVRNQLLVGLPISGLPFDLNEDVIVQNGNTILPRIWLDFNVKLQLKKFLC
jgi:hypothetical protein